MAPGEAAAQRRHLFAAINGKGRIELALDAVLLVPGRLAVAHQQQARRRGSEGARLGAAGLGLLRAREFDLDIYTNFLISRSGSGRS